MFMSVSATPRLPVSLHIGATRALSYEGEIHKNLSFRNPQKLKQHRNG